MIQFERERWSDLETALRREWLETNGLGGFASSTIVGLLASGELGVQLTWKDAKVGD
jgi:hypothetical protein